VTWPDWGNAPAWFSAIGTTSSVVFAVSLYARSLKDKERQQASKVSAWADNPQGWTGEWPRQVLINVHNASDLPIYEPETRTFIPRGDSARVETIEFWHRSTGMRETRQLPAGQSSQQVLELWEGDADYDHVGITFHFTDAAGVAWERDLSGTGKLQQYVAMGKASKVPRWLRRKH